MSAQQCTYCVRGTWVDSNRVSRRCYFCDGTGQVVRRAAPAESNPVTAR